MTAFNYAPLAKTSAQLLKDFGREVILRNKEVPDYDPSTGNVAPSTPTEHKRWAAFFDFERGQTEERGNLVQTKDKRALMEPGIKPSTEDVIVDGDDVWAIISVGELKPGSTAVLYKLHLRHG
jgi:hypothetical protein